MKGILSKRLYQILKNTQESFFYIIGALEQKFAIKISDRLLAKVTSKVLWSVHSDSFVGTFYVHLCCVLSADLIGI